MAEYSIDPVPGASSYQWTLPADWSGASDSTSIGVGIVNTGGMITVAAITACGVGPTSSLQIGLASATLSPGPISGPASICPVVGTATYSVAPVSGAIAYLWTLPAAWSGSSGTETIVATTNGSGGTVSVRIFDGCVNSDPQSLPVSTTSGAPAIPSAISGNAVSCAGSTQVFSVTDDPLASGYNWTLPHPSWSGTSSTSSITLTVGSSSGQLRVVAMNDCGNSPQRVLSVGTMNPPTLLAPNGDVDPCIFTSETYSTNSVSGYVYQWQITGANLSTITTLISSLPVTWIQSGQQSISVMASNSCGFGSPAVLGVYVQECTSVPEEHSAPVWSVYPNPCGDVITVRGPTSTIPLLSFDILDLQGRMVTGPWVRAVHPQSPIDILHLAPGTYLLRIADHLSSRMIKFQKL
jgi:hypothetical protein